MIRHSCAALAIVLLAGCAPKPQSEPLTFSILSAESEKAMSALWEPVITDLSKALGQPVKPFYAANYTAVVEAMRFDKVQMGWFSAQPALAAVRRAEGQVIGRFLDSQGSDSYRSVLIVRKGSGITLDDVMRCDRTLSFGLGDAQSTSGTLAPMTYLFIPKGVTPSDCFKTVRSANHQTNVWGVSKGMLDVATNNSNGLIFARREDPAMMANVETIWESPPLPESSIVVRKTLDPEVKAKVTQFFLTYGKAPGPEGDRQRAVLKNLESRGFKLADNSYLIPVAQMQAAEALAAAERLGDPARMATARKGVTDAGADLAPGAPAAR